jgi:hypothetical protein
VSVEGAVVFADHEVQVALTIHTTHEDVEEALRRSGIVAGALIGEALIEVVLVNSPEVDPA